QVPRSKNKKADALSKIVSTSFAHLSKQVLVEVLETKSITGKEVTAVIEEEGPTWMTELVNYLKEGALPEDEKEARKIRLKARQYELMEGILYKRSFLTPWLRCVGPLQAEYVMKEIHEGSCSMHAGPHDCQIHRPFPKGPGKVKFLIVAMDYFTKWIEAKAVATITGRQVKKFVWDNIVCRFGIPGEIISDNVIPAEIGMPTYRTTAVEVVNNDDELRLSLDLLEERRELAAMNDARSLVKCPISSAHNLLISELLEGYNFEKSKMAPLPGDGRPLICCKCEDPLRGGFCWFCTSNSEISFNNDPNLNSFDDSQNLFDYSPQPQYETYPCKLCGNDLHYGYDCPPRFLLVYEQKLCYNQNYNENYYPHNLPSFLCYDNCEGPYESFQCELMNQNFFEPNPCYESNSSSFDQNQLLQSFVTQQLPQRSTEDIRLEMAKLIKNNRILLNDNIFPHEEASMEVLLAKERILKLIQAWDEKKIESWSLPALLLQLLNDLRTIDEMLKQREQATNLAVQQEQEEQAVQSCTPNWDFLMINDNEEHFIQYKEYLEKSSNTITTVLPTEEPEYSLSMRDEHLSTNSETESYKVIKSSAKNHVLIPSEYEITSDDESECDVPDVPMEDFKVYSNSLFDDEEINFDKVDLHYFNAESDLIKSLSNQDTLFESSPKFDYLEDFSRELMPTSIFDEETDIFTSTDDLMPPGIESEDYESEGDIHIFEELLGNETPPITKNKSSKFDHHDDPSFPRPPPEPSDVEIFFELDSGVLTTNGVKGISEHYVIMPNILPTHPTFDSLYPMYDTLLPFSLENEDKVFKPGILSYLLVSHWDKTTSDFSENPMIVYGGDIPLLDV
nr:reverse transcriptase domain-containing protein [Tanacetum cinerariifolium]